MRHGHIFYRVLDWLVKIKKKKLTISVYRFIYLHLLGNQLLSAILFSFSRFGFLHQAGYGVEGFLSFSV